MALALNGSKANGVHTPKGISKANGVSHKPSPLNKTVILNKDLVAYENGVKEFVTYTKGTIDAKLKLANLRAKALVVLNALSYQQRLEWEKDHIANHIERLYQSKAFISERGTISFKGKDDKQCTASIKFYGDIRLTEEQIIAKKNKHNQVSKDHQTKVRAAAKKQAVQATQSQSKGKAQSKAQDKEEDNVVIEGKPTIAQLKEVIELCTKAQLVRLLELVKAKIKSLK